MERYWSSESWEVLVVMALRLLNSLYTLILGRFICTLIALNWLHMELLHSLLILVYSNTKCSFLSYWHLRYEWCFLSSITLLLLLHTLPEKLKMRLKYVVLQFSFIHSLIAWKIGISVSVVPQHPDFCDLFLCLGFSLYRMSARV